MIQIAGQHRVKPTCTAVEAYAKKAKCGYKRTALYAKTQSGCAILGQQRHLLNANKQYIVIRLSAAQGVCLVVRGILTTSLTLAAALSTSISGLIIAAVVDGRAALSQM